MGSNVREDHHPPHISSLVVRPSGSNDGEGDLHAAAAAEDDSRDRPSFSRSDRHQSDNGHRTSSPPHRRPFEDRHPHGSHLNHSGAPPRGGREFSSRRESSGGRYRDYSPPHSRVGRRFDGPDHEPAHSRPFKSSDVMGRNNNHQKVQPRDGDWYCLDPLCRNLNFARREVCYKCKRRRYAPVNSPPPPRLLPPPINLSPRRDFNGGYRSPPRAYPRDYPLPRLDHPTWRDRDREGDRLHYSNLDYPPNRRLASEWFPEPRYERRPPLSPPHHPPHGGRLGRHSRERSRSPPMRGPPPPLRDYRRDSYFERGGRDDQRGGRDRMMRNAY